MIKRRLIYTVGLAAFVAAGLIAQESNAPKYSKYPDEQPPAKVLPTPAQDRRQVQTIPWTPGDSRSFHTLALEAQARLATVTGADVPGGTIRIEAGHQDGDTRWTDATIFAWERTAWVGESLFVRDNGQRIRPSAKFDYTTPIWQARRSDTRQVNGYVDRWEKAGSDPKQKIRQWTPNYDGNFSAHLRNLAFDCRGPLRARRSRGVVWGGAQTSTVENCEFRWASDIGLHVGNVSTRVELNGLTFAWSPIGLKLTTPNSISGGGLSFLRSAKGIVINGGTGVHLTGISTEHVSTVLVMTGRCIDVEIRGLEIALTSVAPIFDLSGLPDGTWDLGIRISGSIRKTHPRAGNPVWIDRNGQSHVLMTATTGLNAKYFSISQ